MSFSAGEVLTGQKVAALQQRGYDMVASSDVTVSGTVADVTGATTTFSTVYPNAKLKIFIVGDVDATNGTAAIVSVYANVDGTDYASPMTISEQGTSNDSRYTVSQLITVTVASSGSHTVKLRARRVSGTGTADVKGSHTTARVEVEELIP